MKPIYEATIPEISADRDVRGDRLMMHNDFKLVIGESKETMKPESLL